MALTAREHAKLNLIKEIVTFNQEKERVTIKYPFTKDVTKLQDNQGQAIGIATTVETHLEKEGYHEEYDEKIHSYLKRTFVELSEE